MLAITSLTLFLTLAPTLHLMKTVGWITWISGYGIRLDHFYFFSVGLLECHIIHSKSQIYH